MTRLPRTLADLTGLRAARWVRESTRGQLDNFGPEAQREQQDRAIERHQLVDTGIAWTVAHSGKTVSLTTQFSEMLAAAGVSYDVLVVGYVSRFARDLRTAVNARHDLHAAGAAILFADERLLSSDEDQWESFAREAVEAEAYSRRLGRRIREGYEAKFRRLADQGGNAPLGFARVDERHVLEVDPATINQAVEIFRRYSSGTIGLRPLAAELGMDPDGLRAILANPIYNGFARRRRRSPDELLLPAPWRSDPPVSDELWARVEEVRRRRRTGGGHPTPRHAYLLNGLLECVCGSRITAESIEGRRRYRHHRRCPAWSTSTVAAQRFDQIIDAQVSQAALKSHQVAGLRRLAERSGPPPDQLRRRQLERELEDRARAHAQHRLETPAYLAEHERIGAELEALASPSPSHEDPAVAAKWLRDLRRAWRWADVAARHRLAAALYKRVTVTGASVVEVELSATVEAHGLALAMPERVVVLPMLLARPAGDEDAPNIVQLRVVRRREWQREIRRTA